MRDSRNLGSVDFAKYETNFISLSFLETKVFFFASAISTMRFGKSKKIPLENEASPGDIATRIGSKLNIALQTLAMW